MASFSSALNLTVGTCSIFCSFYNSLMQTLSSIIFAYMLFSTNELQKIVTVILILITLTSDIKQKS